MEIHPNPLELSAKQSGISPSFAIWGRKSRNMKVANASEDLVLNTPNQKQKMDTVDLSCQSLLS